MLADVRWHPALVLLDADSGSGRSTARADLCSPAPASSRKTRRPPHSRARMLAASGDPADGRPGHPCDLPVWLGFFPSWRMKANTLGEPGGAVPPLCAGLGSQPCHTLHCHARGGHRDLARPGGAKHTVVPWPGCQGHLVSRVCGPRGAGALAGKFCLPQTPPCWGGVNACWGGVRSQASLEFPSVSAGTRHVPEIHCWLPSQGQSVQPQRQSTIELLAAIGVNLGPVAKIVYFLS